MKSSQDKDRLIDNIIGICQQSSLDGKQIRTEIGQIIDNFLFAGECNEEREVSIMLADIRGFTSLSERHQADEILAMLNNYFKTMNQIIHRYDGLIDKYMGDAIMVVFGINDSPMGENSQRAIACAIEMQISMDQVNGFNRAQGLPELFVGIGINSGRVSAGRVGSEIHNEFTVIGDEVNLASRIESHSLRGQVLISEATYQQVSEEIEVGTINLVRVKGKAEHVKLLEVNSTRWPKDLKVPRREIRTSIRVEFKTSFAFQIIAGKEVLPEIHSGQIEDMSYNGLFAVMPAPFEPMTNIRMMLSISPLGRDSREIYAKITSVRQTNTGFGHGIEFTDIDDESQRAIKEMLDRIISGI